jgi:type IV secretory pathway VirB2 component (pilin)
MTSNLSPDGSNAFVAAVGWLDGLLLGTLASIIAVIAIASIGLLLLSGRVDVRRATKVIIGCFILFGASTIAQGIVRSLASTGEEHSIQQAPQAALPVYPVASSRPASSSPYDPYAGAALPPRR